MQFRDEVCLDSQSIVGVKHDVIVLDSPSPTKSPAKKKMQEEKIVPEVNITVLMTNSSSYLIYVGLII